MNRKKQFLALCLTAGLLLPALPVRALDFGTSEGETEAIAMKVAGEYHKGGYQLISTPELKKWLDDKKEMVIVDTMPYEKSYKDKHLPGAVHFELPIEELTTMDDTTKAEFAKVLGADKDKTLIFYCGFTKCGRSHNGAHWAVELGYKNVYRCPGGIKAWTEADFPVEKVEK